MSSAAQIDADEKPPVFKTWAHLYYALVAYLILLISFLWVITRLLAY